MELHHLHVHDRGAGAVGQADAVAGADQGVGAGLVDAAGAAGGHDHGLGADDAELAGADLHRHAALADAVFDDEVRDEPLFVDAQAVLDQLLVEDVQQRLAGDVTDEVGAGALLAAEGARAELAVLVAVEDDAHALQGEHLGAGLGAEHLDGVLVAQVVAALDRVEGVVLPGVVLVHGGVDTALGGVGVAADRMDLGDDRDVGALRLGGDSGAHAGKPGADYQDIVLIDGHFRDLPSTSSGKPMRPPWPGARASKNEACQIRRSLSNTSAGYR